MATRSRFFRPFLYTSLAAATSGTALYISYRPRNIPGSDPALVPPPKYGEEGRLEPPRFPLVKSREEQVADLKRSSGVSNTIGEKTKGIWGNLTGGGRTQEEKNVREAEPYDLLIIGGGATGTGIALDAATRGLKVAMVERDDFASGTSSKSTKLVHGGVRYLEKAVWELDYNQYDRIRGELPGKVMAKVRQVQACPRSPPRAKVLSRYSTTSFDVAPHYDTHTEVVAGALFLGGD